jgi:hypothetical protein
MPGARPLKCHITYINFYFKVTGTVHTGTMIPGTRSETIMLLADRVIISLIKNVLVIWDGEVDIKKTKQETCYLKAA